MYCETLLVSHPRSFERRKREKNWNRANDFTNLPRVLTKKGENIKKMVFGTYLPQELIM